MTSPELAAGAHRDLERAFVEAMVVEATEREEVVQIGLAAIGPVVQMVALGATRRDTTGGESARRVACPQGEALPWRDRPAGAANIEGGAVALGDRHHFGVTADAEGDGGREGWAVLHAARAAVSILHQDV